MIPGSGNILVYAPGYDDERAGLGIVSSSNTLNLSLGLRNESCPPLNPPNSTGVTLVGTVKTLQGEGISGATVFILDGVNAGRTTTVADGCAAGRYEIQGLTPGNGNVVAFAPLHRDSRGGLAIVTPSTALHFRLSSPTAGENGASPPPTP